MPIDPLLAQESFDPETTAALAAAFDAAWDAVRRSRAAATATSAESAREQLARLIIAAARDGERDPHRLVEQALSGLAMHPAAQPDSDPFGSAG